MHLFPDPDPPVSYDLNFIDTTDQQVQYKSNAFKLSTQATSPTGDEEDSIAKVLDWFNRSTDSSDWLKTQDDPGATEKHGEIDQIKYEDSMRNDSGDINRREETLEKERSPLRRQTNEALGVRDNKEQIEEMMTDVRERRMQPQEVKDNDDDWQSPKISHLKSFWEKSNNGPKILISKSVSPSDSEQKPARHPVEKDEEGVNTQDGEFNMPRGINTSKGNDAENDRDQMIVTGSQADSTDRAHLNLNSQDLPEISAHVLAYDDLLNLQSSAQERRQSDMEVSRATRPGSQTRTAVQSRETPGKENQQPYTLSRFQEDLPKTMSVPGPDVDVNTSDDENDAQVAAKENICRHSSDGTKRMEREGDTQDSNFNNQGLPQETTAERIKQLQWFWEQEMNKPAFYNDKPKTDGRVARGANRTRLNKRFTKSEYDLTSVGNDSAGDVEDANRKHHNFTVLPLSQRTENLSPSLNMSRSNFNTLRVFWDEAAAETKAPSSYAKAKPPKRKEPVSAYVQSQELKWGDPEVYSTVDKTRQSSPPPQSRSKSPQTRPTVSGTKDNSSQSSFTTTESKKSLKEFNREDKATKSQLASGREARSPKGRKDSFGNSSSRSSLRRATSMFALCGPDEKGQRQLQTDASPVQAQSRRERQSRDKGVVQRRASEETETLTPLARAFVPRDYRHYLGMTDSAFAPAVSQEGLEGKSEHEFDPVRASTPVCPEERYGRKANRAGQRPLSANCSSSDAGQDSALSSTSDTRSISRNSSKRKHQN